MLCVKIITKSKTCHDVVGIRTELLSDTSDVDIHRTVGNNYIGGPDAADEVVTRIHASHLFQQGTENAKLSLGEHHVLPVDLYYLAVKVNNQPLILQLMLGLL